MLQGTKSVTAVVQSVTAAIHNYILHGINFSLSLFIVLKKERPIA